MNQVRLDVLTMYTIESLLFYGWPHSRTWSHSSCTRRETPRVSSDSLSAQPAFGCATCAAPGSDDWGWLGMTTSSASYASIIQSSSYRAGAPQRCFKRRSKCSLSWPPSRPTKGSSVGQPKPRENVEYLAFKDCTLSNSIVAATRSFGLSNVYNLKLYKYTSVEEKRVAANENERSSKIM